MSLLNDMRAGVDREIQTWQHEEPLRASLRVMNFAYIVTKFAEIMSRKRENGLVCPVNIFFIICEEDETLHVPAHDA